MMTAFPILKHVWSSVSPEVKPLFGGRFLVLENYDRSLALLNTVCFVS